MENLLNEVEKLTCFSQAKITKDLCSFIQTLNLNKDEQDMLNNILKEQRHDYLDLFDFDNAKRDEFTYSKAKRNVIDILQEDMELSNYSSRTEKITEYDHTLLDNPSFENYRYTRRELIEWTIGNVT